MPSRKHIHRAYEGRPSPSSGLLRHGPLTGGHRSLEAHPPHHLENSRLASQEADIQQLTDDNRRLAMEFVALKQDLSAAQNEVDKLSDHIRSMREGSDIEIRSMLDEIKNMELEIKAGENVEKDLNEALVEARRLVLDRQEMKSKLQLATRELNKALADVKRVPEINAELDSLRQEHQSLRVTFEYEKGLNIKKVERMRGMEKDVLAMAGEVERLRTEQRSNATQQPYGGSYISPTTFYPPSSIYESTGGYVGNFSRPPPPVSGGYSSWSETYDVSHGGR